MSLLQRLTGPGKEEVWRDLAERRGGRFLRGGLLGADAVQIPARDWIITLDTESSGGATTYTRLRAPFVNPGGFSFEIYRAGFVARLLGVVPRARSGLGRLPGLQDIQVGDPLFDRDHLIKGNSVNRVRKFLENDRIRELIRRQPRITFGVRSDEGWFGVKFPAGVDELYFRCPGVIKDLGHLEGLFELFAESLHQLCHDGKAYEGDVDIHIQRLQGPGGQIRGKHLLWDGDPPRRDAAATLGRLKDPKAIETLVSVLGSEDRVLRAHAIHALGSIGDGRAIGPLIVQLGHTDWADGKRLPNRVAEALRPLGESELVDAVLAALAGDASRIKGAVGAYRGQVIQAFLVALDGPSGITAARSLEELHAVEALPEMRKILRGTGARSRTGTAIQAAIRELESRAALPRPAEAREVSAATLPRVAHDSGPATETLPRAVEEGD